MQKRLDAEIDVSAVPVRVGAGYPELFNDACAGRTRKRLGDAGKLTAFGVNLMTLPPGKWSSPNKEGRFVHKDGAYYG